jgi:hypothetical protein
MGKSPKSMASKRVNEIATVRIELCRTDPLIWREVEVPTSMTLLDLHYVIQAAMGWSDDHMWDMHINKQGYGEPMPVLPGWDRKPILDPAEVRLCEVLRPRRTTIDYLYDYGDSWAHKLLVTRIRAGDPNTAYPRYVGGENNSPLEDCGGVYRFYDRLEALADPDHPDHDSARERMGDYDPDVVDEEQIRGRLAGIASGLAAAKAR